MVPLKRLHPLHLSVSITSLLSRGPDTCPFLSPPSCSYVFLSGSRLPAANLGCAISNCGGATSPFSSDPCLLVCCLGAGVSLAERGNSETPCHASFHLQRERSRLHLPDKIKVGKIPPGKSLFNCVTLLCLCHDRMCAPCLDTALLSSDRLTSRHQTGPLELCLDLTSFRLVGSVIMKQISGGVLISRYKTQNLKSR